MATYNLNLDDMWFLLIRSGEKRVEGRLNKNKFSNMQVGDRIVWSNKNYDSFESKIVEISTYDSFRSCIVYEGLKNILPHKDIMSIESGISVYRRFYSEEDEERYGVLGIEIQNI